MGQHLGFNANSNVLRKHLTDAIHNLDLERCSFKLVAHGPLFAEETSDGSHRKSRDIVAALEKALADAMKSAGYQVINSVNCLKPLDETLFRNVRTQFSKHFGSLG